MWFSTFAFIADVSCILESNWNEWESQPQSHKDPTTNSGLLITVMFYY